MRKARTTKGLCRFSPATVIPFSLGTPDFSNFRSLVRGKNLFSGLRGYRSFINRTSNVPTTPLCIAIRGVAPSTRPSAFITKRYYADTSASNPAPAPPPFTTDTIPSTTANPPPPSPPPKDPAAEDAAIRADLAKNKHYYYENHETLLETYKNKWIAISKQKVAASNMDAKGLLPFLGKIHSSRRKYF